MRHVRGMRRSNQRALNRTRRGAVAQLPILHVSLVLGLSQVHVCMHGNGGQGEPHHSGWKVDKQQVEKGSRAERLRVHVVHRVLT